MMNLYVNSYPTSFPNYIFIEVVLKSYLDKLYFHKLYDELMHQNCVKNYLKKYTESCTQKLYDEFHASKSYMMNLCKRICKRNLPDKDNILQVMLKIMLHKYLKKSMH